MARVIKIVVWILVLYIIQTAFGGLISVWNCIPELVFGFAVILCLNERDFKTRLYVTLATSLIIASEAWRCFGVVVLGMGVACAAADVLQRYFRFVPLASKALLITVLAVYCIDIAELFIQNSDISIAALYGTSLYTAIYTGLTVCIMYPLVIKTLYTEKKKKLLIV